MSYSSEVLADTPIAYWRLGEASGASSADSSGNTRTATWAGSYTKSVPGLLVSDPGDFAVSVSGAGYADTAFSSTFNPANLSIEAWIKPSAIGTYMLILDRDNGGGSGGRMFQFRVTDVGKLQLIWWTTGGAGPFFANGATTLVAGTTYHVAATMDGSNGKVYLNGVLDGTTAQAGSMQTSATLGIRIGASTDYLGPIYQFKGVLDEVAFYGTALSATRLAAHYSAGMAAPPAGPVVKQVATGATTVTISVVPAVGDVIILAGGFRGGGGGLKSVTGCGATWLKADTFSTLANGVGSGDTNFQEDSVEVWVGRGATTAGAIAVVPVIVATPMLAAYLVSGTDGVVGISARAYAAASTYPRQGPVEDAKAGQVVIDIATAMDVAVPTYPSASQPSGWTSSYVGLGDGWARIYQAYRVPTETSATPHSTSLTSTAAYSSQVVQIKVGSDPPKAPLPAASVLEVQSATFNATTTAGNGVDLTFTTTPQAGDVVAVVLDVESNPLGGVQTIAGLGASFALARSKQFSANQTFYLYLGTGANAAGVLRVTRTTGGGTVSVRAVALLIRGLSNANITAEQLNAWNSTELFGAGASASFTGAAGPGSLVLAITEPSGSTYTLPSAASSAGFTVDKATLGAGSALGVAWKAFTAASTPDPVVIGVTSTVNSTYLPLAVYYIGGPETPRLTGQYADVLTQSSVPPKAAIDGIYAEVATQGTAPSMAAIDGVYAEVLSVVAPPPPYAGPTPATIVTDKTLWLRASDLTGTTVTTWADQSGKGNNVSGMSSCALESGAGPSNTKALRVSGGTIQLASPTTLGLVVSGVHQAAELWVLAQLVATDGGAWHFGSGSSQNHFVYQGQVYNDFGNATRRNYTPSPTITAGGPWRLIRLAITANGTVVDHIDNVQQQKVAGVTKAWGTTAFLSETWNGRFAEALLIPGGTTFKQKQDLTDYYNGVYNLSVAAPTASAEDVPEPVATQGFWGMLLQGGPPPALPATLAGVQLWLRGKDNTGANGSNIDPWVDQSGNNRNGTATNNFPSVAAAATPNGGKAVQFGNTGHFAIPGPFVSAPASAEVWTVVKSEHATFLNGIWQLNTGSGLSAHSFYPYSDGRLIEGFGVTNAGAFGTPNLQMWRLYRVTNDGTNLSTYLDGVLQGTVTVASSGGASWPTTGMMLGRTKYGGTTTIYFIGKIAEVLIRDRISTAGEAASLITYFNTEHGLTVPGGS